MKLSLEERKSLLIQLGKKIGTEEGMPPAVVRTAVAHNPWFTEENILHATSEMATAYMGQQEVEQWTGHYKQLADSGGRRVGLLMAGNIPLVGLHDLVCNFLAGHKSLIKLSDKDAKVIPFLIDVLTQLNPKAADYFEIVERLMDYDAVIATGSDTSGRYFKKYFGSVPNIIRLNRNGVAVVDKDTTDESLSALGKDIFSYFGLGCRNVSKLYLEQGFDIQRIFKSIEKYRVLIHHNKYKNNYDYNYALYMMNTEKFLTNDFLILRENETIASRIASVHYSYFENATALSQEIVENKLKIQCIISDREIGDHSYFKFGKAQQPSAMDYADGVDTLEFLIGL